MGVEQFHDAGVFDCSSPYWDTIFEAVPEPTPMMEARHLDSKETFLFMGMYLFCLTVRDGSTKVFEYTYDPGVASGDSERCATQDSVMGLQEELMDVTAEYIYWMNFNEWLGGVKDDYDGIIARTCNN